MNETEIEASSREKLHELILTGVGESALDQIDLPKLLWEAGVSERSFAAAYDDVEECAFAAYDEQAMRLDAAVREACDAAGASATWPQRVRAGLAALLAELSARPAVATAMLRSFPAIGPEARARSQAFHESFGPMLSGGREASGLGEQLPREVETLATGAAEAILFEEVVSGRAAGLGSMLPALLFSVLVPFLGPERAAEEMNRARDAD
jgi:AcrR family transcriptional regulator